MDITTDIFNLYIIIFYSPCLEAIYFSFSAFVHRQSICFNFTFFSSFCLHPRDISGWHGSPQTECYDPMSFNWQPANNLHPAKRFSSSKLNQY